MVHQKIILTLFFLLFSINSHSQDVDHKTSAMLLVSLGMPKPLLRQYLVQAKDYHIPLVLRGLIDNQYPKTAKKIAVILHPKNRSEIKSGFEIDPYYFRQYKIKAVPALLIFNQDNKNHYTVIYGNIPIQQSLAIIAKKSKFSDIKNFARNILENGL